MLTKTIYLIRNTMRVGKCKLDIDTNNIAFLWNVKIYGKYRGNGYCKYLVRKAVNLAKQVGIKKIYLHVKCDNKPAIKCYINNKFKITRKNYDDNNNLFGYTMIAKI